MTETLEIPENNYGKLSGNSRGFWHYEARRMKAEGMDRHQIANKLGKTLCAVTYATVGVAATSNHRPFYKETRGFKGTISGVATGRLKRVAIAFNDQQLDAINLIAQEQQLSFSKIVSDLVDQALLEAAP